MDVCVFCVLREIRIESESKRAVPKSSGGRSRRGGQGHALQVYAAGRGAERLLL